MKTENIEEKVRCILDYIRILKNIEEVKECNDRNQLEYLCHQEGIEIAIPILDALKTDAVSKLEKKLAELEILVNAIT